MSGRGVRGGRGNRGGRSGDGSSPIPGLRSPARGGIRSPKANTTATPTKTNTTPRAQKRIDTRTYAYTRKVPVPPTLVQWSHSDEALEILEQSAIGVSRIQVVDPTYANMKQTVVELHGEYDDEVNRAVLLVEAVLQHRVRLAQRLGVKQKLDDERAKIQNDIDAGLRCEFAVQQSLFGMVMGHKGSRVRAAQEQCAIQAIVVDRDALVIRIVGSDPR